MTSKATKFGPSIKIYFSETCRVATIEWYHKMLRHSGAERTAKIIHQYFDWPGSVERIKIYIKKCAVCRKSKITGVRRYGKVPLPESNEASVPPFHTVHVDTVGPRKVYFKIAGKKVGKDARALTVDDSATSRPRNYSHFERGISSHRRTVRQSTVV